MQVLRATLNLELSIAPLGVTVKTRSMSFGGAVAGSKPQHHISREEHEKQARAHVLLFLISERKIVTWSSPQHTKAAGARAV